MTGRPAVVVLVVLMTIAIAVVGYASYRVATALPRVALELASILPTARPSPTAAPASATTAAGSARTIRIVSSLPMTGTIRSLALEMVNAIKMAVEETKIPGLAIQYDALDDATVARNTWDAAQEAANARTAINDPAVVAYIGPFNSGAAKVSIPLLNQAGLVMVSPSNTYPGITKPGMGDAGEPNKFYPNGKRNYARVVPTDDLQGTVGAAWAKDLGAKRVFIVHDSDLYGRLLADAFRTKARSIDLQEAGYEAAPKADNYRALASRIKDSGADFTYYGGIVDNNPAALVKDLKAVAPSVKFMGPDGINCSEFLKAAGPAADGVYSTFGSQPVATYAGKAADWLRSYRARWNSLNPNPYAIYGYEAAKVVLAAIVKSGSQATDRATVLANVMGTKGYDGVLGRWSFDANGDTTLVQVSGSVARNGAWSYVKELGGLN